MTDQFQIVLSYTDGRDDEILVLEAPDWGRDEDYIPFVDEADALGYFCDATELQAVSITKVGGWV